MDNPIPATAADVKTVAHYSEVFADLMETLRKIRAIAVEKRHEFIKDAVDTLLYANAKTYAKMVATTIGDNGQPIAESDRMDFVRWLGAESQKLLLQASMAQFFKHPGRTNDQDDALDHDEGRGF